jgi:GT2 family glycosyltransferase
VGEVASISELGEPVLGVVVVTFSSSNVIEECLESLAASVGVRLKVVVVDNASADDTCQVVLDWATGAKPFVQPEDSPLPRTEPVSKPRSIRELRPGEGASELEEFTLIQSDVNRGFAGGVNVGLKALDGHVEWYWVLNPDCVVPPHTARAFVDAARSQPDFSLMTSRTVYYHRPDRIQTDGGQVNRVTGSCRQRSLGRDVATTPLPRASELDWVTGANMVVSQRFLSSAGLMPEDYFLYFEEVDWAFRRGDLPLAIAADAIVYHRGGTAIGSGDMDRRASPFANYFNHRNRIRFARRHLSPVPLAAYLFGLAKATQLALVGAGAEALAVIAGMFDLRPPREISRRFPDPRAAELAFGRRAR